MSQKPGCLCQNDSKTIVLQTIIQTAVDVDKCIFDPPTTIGSFLTLERAVSELEELIPMARKKLDDRYDMESRDTRYWEAYQDGYAASCFLRLDIVPTEMTFSMVEFLQTVQKQETEQLCRKPACPHTDAEMCRCEPVAAGSAETAAIHLYQNVRGLKMELGYQSLMAPAPYRLCASGSCKVCGGRLCIGVKLSDFLYGNGFLAEIYHHMKSLHMNEPRQIAALFHEEDQAIVLQWLEENGLAEKGDCYE